MLPDLSSSGPLGRRLASRLCTPLPCSAVKVIMDSDITPSLAVQVATSLTFVVSGVDGSGYTGPELCHAGLQEAA